MPQCDDEYLLCRTAIALQTTVLSYNNEFLEFGRSSEESHCMYCTAANKLVCQKVVLMMFRRLCKWTIVGTCGRCGFSCLVYRDLVNGSSPDGVTTTVWQLTITSYWHKYQYKSFLERNHEVNTGMPSCRSHLAREAASTNLQQDRADLVV